MERMQATRRQQPREIAGKALARLSRNRRPTSERPLHERTDPPLPWPSFTRRFSFCFPSNHQHTQQALCRLSFPETSTTPALRTATMKLWFYLPVIGIIAYVLDRETVAGVLGYPHEL